MIEAAVLFYHGATWPIPHIAMAVIALGLLLPAIAFFARVAVAGIALVYAFMFVFPGSLLLVLGSCGGIMNSSCSDAEFWRGIAGFGIAVVVNFAAAAILAKAANPDPPSPPQR